MRSNTKTEAVFSPTKYCWKIDKKKEEQDGITIVLAPEKVKSISLSQKKKEVKKELSRRQREKYINVQDFLCDLPYDISQRHKYMKNAPLILPLKNCGVLGVALDNENDAKRLIDAIIYELCFYHSPEDLQFIVLYNEAKIEEYQKYKFSAHFRELLEDNSQFVFDINNAKTVFDKLLDILTKRKNSKEDEDNKKFPDIVVVVYEEYGIKEHAVANFLPKAPKEGENYLNELGITFIFCSKARGLLPSYCGYTVENEGNKDNKTMPHLIPRHDFNQKKEIKNGILNITDGIKLDFYKGHKVLSEIYYTRIAQNANVPSYVTLLELYNKDIDTTAFWSVKRDVTDGLSVPIGKSDKGIISLDLHEKADGCHMLVAGTTGSGKSETIISILISLCLYYTPEDLNLLLIDMKGGGFIKRLGSLPHIVGTVTDVDGDENGTGAEYMLKRFLESLTSEIKRRKILLNKMGVDNLDGYIRKYKAIKEEGTEVDEKLPALSHLVFVVDEFTELKRASTEGKDIDFIGEITTISRVGRSLGFHVILISQNIEGAITDDIRVNSKSRLCLKVATNQASKEMLENVAAAAPDMPGNGRTYLKVGTGSRFEYFQSAYSGAENDDSAEMPFEIIQINKNGKHTIFYDSKKRTQKTGSGIDKKQTELEYVIEKIIENFNRGKYEAPHIIFKQPLSQQIVFNNGNEFYVKDGEGWKTLWTN